MGLGVSKTRKELANVVVWYLVVRDWRPFGGILIVIHERPFVAVCRSWKRPTHGLFTDNTILESGFFCVVTSHATVGVNHLQDWTSDVLVCDDFNPRLVFLYTVFHGVWSYMLKIASIYAGSSLYEFAICSAASILDPLA